MHVMFKSIRHALWDIATEIRGCQEALRGVVAALEESDSYQGLRDRLDALEGDTTRRLAEVDGLLAKAEGFKHAARAAEERARGHLARAEALTDEGSVEGNGGFAPIPNTGEDLPWDDVEPGPGGRMQEVPSTVEQLRQAKFRSWGN